MSPDEIGDRLKEKLEAHVADLDNGKYKVADLNTIALWHLYLWGSLLYYREDMSPMSDDTFDAVCQELYKRAPEDGSRHQDIRRTDAYPWDRQAFKAGTGFHVTYQAVSLPIVRAAETYVAENM